MRVEEARTKVCPYIVDTTKQDSGSACGCSNLSRNINCITSECMAWKWSKIYSGTPNLYGIYPKEEISSTDGYCMRLTK